MKRVLLVAGEASGDGHAAGLVEALRRRVPDVEVFGVGGAGCRAQGMRTVVDSSTIATMGLTEVAEKARALLRAYRWLSRTLRQERPDLLVLVDFPEFNLALARVAGRAGVPVFYYVSPQVWAWRRGRVRKILRRVDRLAVIFPFEPAAYGNSEKVVFVGHPLLDHVRATRSREETLRAHGLDAERPLVLLMPGSRRREIEEILPTMAAAAERLVASRRLQCALALAPTVPAALVDEVLRGRDGALPSIAGDAYNLIAASDLVLVASGTATLEVAILERPMVIAYKASALTFFIAKRLVHVPWVGMPNLLAGRQIVPELLQRALTAEGMATAAGAILDDPERARRTRQDLAAVRPALGVPGAAERAAALAAELLAPGGEAPR